MREFFSRTGCKNGVGYECERYFVLCVTVNGGRASKTLRLMLGRYIIKSEEDGNALHCFMPADAWICSVEKYPKHLN